MTGFGSAEGKVQGGRLRIEIRSVNHRYYNPQLRLPFELAAAEQPIREHLRQLLDRGHVALSARWLEQPRPGGTVLVDIARARQVVAALKELKKQLRLKGEPDLAFVARHPEVLTLQANGEGEQAGDAAGEGVGVGGVWSELRPVVDAAAREVVAMREGEGQALAVDLMARLEAIEQGAGTVETRAPARLAGEYTRLKKAVTELAAGIQVDEQRLAVEIALLADRVDITEELVRLRTHLAACREALRSDGRVGKQLGFLAQELLREVNTIGSKANDAAITQTVIAMKGELEKFREQLENLE